MNAASFFLGLLGASSVFGVALGSWQKYIADRVLENLKQSHSKDLEEIRNSFQLQMKQLEAALERRQSVSKAQFDVEFSAMREAYNLASQLLLQLRAIRPMFERSPRGEDQDGYKIRLHERVSELAGTHDLLLKYHESHRPFLAEQVYAALVGMSRTARFEVNQVWNPHPSFRSSEWYAQGEKNLSDCEGNHDALVTGIRQRLKQLEVVV